jgi:hypothetical protein
MAISPEYMKVLNEFSNLIKTPKSECQDKAAHVLATIEEYREDHPKVPGHTMRSLDRMENACRERLGLPLIKRSFLEKVIMKLS